jgi:4-amino-4-deoxy-L-arabinose transferase-like glycosyltransferase
VTYKSPKAALPWSLVFLCAAFAVAWFGTLDYRKLIKPDEGRYAEIAREMAASGDWITPRLNGIKYFEKPPLQYWATAAAFAAFGENEWTARLWPGVTGFLGVLLALYTGTKLYGLAAGALAAMVLGSSLLYLFIGHMNTLDMGVAFFLEVALCGFLLSQSAAAGGPSAGSAARRRMLVAWLAMALAVLSKGLIGLVLPAATLVAYSVLQRDPGVWKRMHFGWGLLLFFAVASPWFVAASIVNPEFFRFFFIHEHFERFLTSGHSRQQPIWYFVPVTLAGLLPWTTIALHAAVSAWRHRVTPQARGSFDSRRFLSLWAVVIFVFFSASGSKLPSYVLPLFPALALLAGDLLARGRFQVLRWHLVVAAVIALACLAALLRLAVAGDSETPADMIARYRDWLLVAASVFLVAAAMAVWRNERRHSLQALAVLTMGAFIASSIALQGHESLGRSNSSYYIAGQVKPLLRPDVPFYSVGMYEQTLPFYLERTMTLVEYRDEFAFGLDHEPHLSIPSMDAFRARWDADREAFAVTTESRYREMESRGFPMKIVARDSRRIIVAKP